MAEVKTYKCDICGEVYHVDDNDEKVMTINYKVDSENEGKFEHICDDCMYTIHRCIQNPDIIDNKEKTLSTVRDAKHKFETCLREVYRAVCPDYWLTVGGLYDVYNGKPDDKATAIIDTFDELEKSRRVWRLVASAGIGVIIGNVIALLLKLFV